MNKVRKKRKPDTLKVNFVVGNSGSRELNIQPVTYLFKNATHDESGRAGGHVSDSITDRLPIQHFFHPKVQLAYCEEEEIS